MGFSSSMWLGAALLIPERNVDPDELDWDEDLVEQGSVWTPNYKCDAGRYYDLSNHTSFDVFVDQKMIESSIANFQIEFESHLKALRDRKISYKIVFGAFAEAS